MSHDPAEWTCSLGELESEVTDSLAALQEREFSRRLWERDPSLWKAEPEHQRVISKSLGWLAVPSAMLDKIAGVLDFVEEVRHAGFSHAVLLGMGGSSLCPDVCRASFGTAPGYLDLQVLDSTVPATVARVEKSIDLQHTLFLVSSKSGGTIETLSGYKYFFDRVRSLEGERAGGSFIAITDPGTPLEQLARERNFRAIFRGHVDIGGRFSALSNFGIVPAALMGVDVRLLLEGAEKMMHACAASVPAQENPGVVLGAVLGAAGHAGRDKVTFVMSPGIYTFADWVEQLIAESTGKESKGLVPVVREHLDDPKHYGGDRLFVYMRLSSEADEKVEQRLRGLEAAGHPVVRIELESRLDLGQEFFRWEVATAAVGALLGINPFDQPNVQETKDNTNRLLARFQSQGQLEEERPTAESEELKLHCSSATQDSLDRIRQRLGFGGDPLEDYCAAFLTLARPGDYVGFLPYLDPSSGHRAVLRAIRARLRDALAVATTIGFGPRYLHSTGQLHKGGSNKGLFIVLTADDAEDLPVPGESYTFSRLKLAQALGDFQALVSKNRRVIRLHMGKCVQAGLDRLLSMVAGALEKCGGLGGQP